MIMKKKAIILALSVCMVFTGFESVYASEEYVIGFNDNQTEISIKNGGGYSKVDIDTRLGCVAFSPNYEKNVAISIPVDKTGINGKDYVKIRYFFRNSVNKDAEFVIKTGDESIIIDSFVSKNQNEWYEAVTAAEFKNADSQVEIYPVKSDDWSSGGTVYIDYIGFFENEQAAKDYKEYDDDDDLLDIFPSADQTDEKSVKLNRSAAYISGYAERTFKPDSFVTRAEISTMLSRVIASNEMAEELPYSDVDANAWYYENICKLFKNGIITEESNFRPDEDVTRAEFAYMLYRLGAFTSEENKTFPDVPVTEELYGILVHSANIFMGYEDGTFRPLSYLTRAEAVTTINKVLGISADSEQEFEELFKDVPSSFWAFRDIMLVSDAAVGKSGGRAGAVLANGKFDVSNSWGAEWEPVPFVSQKLLDEGHSGGEGGQYLTWLTADLTGNILISFADVGNVQRSKDGGDNWIESGRGVNASGLSMGEIDPNNPDRVIAISGDGGYGNSKTYIRQKRTGEGLYLSEDCAENFKQVMIYNDRAIARAKHLVAWDPTSYDEKIGGSSIVYYSPISETVEDGTKEIKDYEVEQGWNEGLGLYRSDDGGYTWKLVNSEMLNADLMVSFEDGTLYALQHETLYKSTDKGVNFTAIQTGVDAYDLIYTEPKSVYIAKITGVEKTEDGGKTWKKIGKSGMGEGAMVFRVSPANPKHMAYFTKSTLIDDRYQITYTVDGGDSWAQSTYSGNGFYALHPRAKMIEYHPTDENTVWTTADMVEVSHDAGKTFDWDQDGAVATCINSWWRPNTYNPDYMMIPAQDFHGVVSFDGGKTSTNIVDFGSPQDVHHVYGGYVLDENTVFICNTANWESKTENLMATFDGGEHWETLLEVDNGYLYNRMFQSPTDPNVVFCGKYRSLDGGHNWEQMEGIYSVMAYNKDYPTIFAIGASRYEILKTNDNGTTWQKVITVEPDKSREYNAIQYAVDYDYKNDILYFNEYGYLWKYQNGVLTSLEPNMKEITKSFWAWSMAVDPINPEVIYVGGTSSDSSYHEECDVLYTILRSCDSGETWQVISTVDNDKTVVKTGPVVGRHNIKNMFVHPETGYLWVGMANTGTYKIAPPYKLND